MSGSVSAFTAYKTVGVFIEQLHRSGRHKYLAELAAQLKNYGYKTLCFNSYSDLFNMDKNDEGERSIIELGMRSSLSAILLYSELIKDESTNRAVIDFGKKRGIPVFCVERAYDDAINIKYDYGEVFERIVDHVIEEHGAHDLRLMSGIRGNDFSIARNEAFLRSLRSHGIAADESLIYYGEFWSEPTKHALKQLLEECTKLPEAIVCANDSMAITVCHELESRGIHVPDDIIVTGIDGLNRALENIPTITTAEPDHKAAARFIAECVNAAEKGETILPQTRVFGFSLIHGQSCGCCESSNAIAGVINARLNERRDREQLFRIYMDHMVLQNTDGRTVENALRSIGHYIGQVTYRGIEIYIDPRYFGDPYETGVGKILAARTLPDSSDYEVPFSVFPDEELCTEQMLSSTDSLIFVPLHRQDMVYGYVAAQFRFDDIEGGERLYDCVMHLNMLFSSIEAVTKLHETILKLDNMYVRDPLTNLLNRRGFRRELPALRSKASAEGKRLAVISADMDGLKYINDTFGHSEGDFAIAALAHIMSRLVEGSGICARFGGDEYIAVAAVGSEPPDYAAQLKELLDNLNSASGKAYTIAASIGVEFAECAEVSVSLEELIKIADDKMYESKRKSKFSRTALDI